MSNKIFLTFCNSTNLGGAETLTTRIINYLAADNKRTYMFATKDDYAFNNLSSKNQRNIIRIPIDDFCLSSKNISPRTLSKFTERVLEYIPYNTENLYIYAPYFNNIQLMSLVFYEIRNAKLFTGYLHPEAWPGSLFPFFSRFKKTIKPIKKSRLYHFQQINLINLDRHSANWFMNDIVKKYHEYYYDIELRNAKVIPLPFDIPNVGENTTRVNEVSQDKLKVVWLGRFEYFKNPAIKKVYNALSNLVNKYKEMKIEFDLIGYGRKEYEKDVRKYVKTDNRLEVKYLGKIFPDKLHEVLAQYDVGVAMGTSALHIASMKIPTILVDASDEKHISQIKGCWLNEAPTGFLGEGIYADICGYGIETRRNLLTLFEELLNYGTQSGLIGEKCYEYIHKYYDRNKIMPQIIDAWTSSTFSPADMEVYRHLPIERLIRRAAIKLLKK